tara:strand:+ start:1490 stop:2239 length:750 start_codon:yes stop_codon:yes gene_type:complete
MGFKMKGFSYPGKAPLKQTDDGLGDITVGTGLRGTSSGDSDAGGISIEEMKDYIDKMYGNKELGDKYTETGDKVDETRTLPEGTEDYLKSKEEGYNVWKDKYLKSKITDPTAKKEMEESKKTLGLQEGEMAVSKAEIKGRKSRSKAKQKASKELTKKTKTGKWLQKAGRKVVGITAEERATNKLQKLRDKKRLAEATGQLGVKLDVMSGFGIGAQADKLEGRIKKKEARIEARKTRKATRKTTKKIKNK